MNNTFWFGFVIGLQTASLMLLTMLMFKAEHAKKAIREHLDRYEATERSKRGL